MTAHMLHSAIVLVYWPTKLGTVEAYFQTQPDITLW